MSNALITDWSFAFTFAICLAVLVVFPRGWRSYDRINVAYNCRGRCCTSSKKVSLGEFLNTRIINSGVDATNLGTFTGRSSVFFYRFTSDLIAECLVPPITSILMAKSLWLPLLAALGFQLLGVLLTFVLPETLPIESSGQDPGVFDDNQPVARIVEADEGLLLENERENDEKWKIWIRKTRKSFSFVTRDATVVALVFTFLISKVGRQSINILLQYVSKRYDWSLSKVSTPH